MTYPPVPPRADEVLLADLRHDLPPAVLSSTVNGSGSRPQGAPLAVVHASDADHVRTTLRHAHRQRVPVVPRVADSGLSGAPAAGPGSLVLDLSRMKRILDLDPHERIAVVEPGATTAELDHAAAGFGLRYAAGLTDTAAFAVVDGAATSPPGPRCATCLGTRDTVLGLDVVLADGTLIRTGHRTGEATAGYDLTALLTGSGGTLGVITAAAVRLRPAPVATVAAAYFDTFAAAAEALSPLAKARLEPSVAELLDGRVLAAVDEAQGTDLRRRGDALLLLWWDGRSAAAEAESAVRLLRERASSVEATTDPAEADRLLTVRRQALPSLERLGRVLIQDIAVRRSELDAVVRESTAVAEHHGVRIFTFAHAADGLLHSVLLHEPADSDSPDAVSRAADDIVTAVSRLGGAVTAERGTGPRVHCRRSRELAPEQRALRQRIKAAFDPRHILVPGEID